MFPLAFLADCPANWHPLCRTRNWENPGVLPAFRPYGCLSLCSSYYLVTTIKLEEP